MLSLSHCARKRENEQSNLLLSNHSDVRGNSLLTFYVLTRVSFFVTAKVGAALVVPLFAFVSGRIISRSLKQIH